VGRIPVVLAHAVVIPVQVTKLQRRFAFELLDEMTMPIKAADKSLQTGALLAGAGRELGGEQARRLRHLAQAQAAQREIGRKS
jgi:hypothetical protein